VTNEEFPMKGRTRKLMDWYSKVQCTKIRILRVLGLLDRLETLVPETGPRPMDLLKLKGKVRKRASGKRKPTNEIPWKWGDEA